MKEPLVTMLGSLPPLKAISIYCWGICFALARCIAVECFSFKRLYPEWIYPGGTKDEDPTWDVQERENLEIHRSLTYYNPFSWLICGLRAKGRLIHVQWWSLPVGLVWIVMLLVLRLRRRRVVVTVHNVEQHEKGFFDHLVRRIVFSMAHAFIVHCEENRQQLAENMNIALDRIHVMEMPVFKQYCDPALTQEEARQHLGLEPRGTAFLLFGNMRDYKGVDVFLRAFAALPDEQRQRGKVLIIGQTWGDLADEYDALIGELGLRERVMTCYDYVPMGEVKYYFEAANVVALPYRHFAAQSAVGSLALAFGKPLLVTRVGGLPTLARREEAICEPDDVASLRNRIARLLDDAPLRDQLAADSQALAAQRDARVSAERTIDIYESVMGEDFLSSDEQE